MKFISSLISLVLVVAFLAGCGNNNSTVVIDETLLSSVGTGRDEAFITLKLDKNRPYTAAGFLEGDSFSKQYRYNEQTLDTAVCFNKHADDTLTYIYAEKAFPKTDDKVYRYINDTYPKLINQFGKLSAVIITKGNSAAQNLDEYKENQLKADLNALKSATEDTAITLQFKNLDRNYGYVSCTFSREGNDVVVKYEVRKEKSIISME